MQKSLKISLRLILCLAVSLFFSQKSFSLPATPLPSATPTQWDSFTPGPTVTVAPTSTPSTNDKHYECLTGNDDKYACVEVPNAPGNASDKCNPGDPNACSKLKCVGVNYVNSTCQTIPGNSISAQCSDKNEGQRCGPDPHTGANQCQGTNCKFVPGAPGPNECSDGIINIKCYDLDCVNGTCQKTAKKGSIGFDNCENKNGELVSEGQSCASKHCVSYRNGNGYFYQCEAEGENNASASTCIKDEDCFPGSSKKCMKIENDDGSVENVCATQQMGQGGNGCKNDSDCASYACSKDNRCILSGPAGQASSCAPGDDGGCAHYECQDKECAKVSGAGLSTCNPNSIGGCSHKICQAIDNQPVCGEAPLTTSGQPCNTTENCAHHLICDGEKKCIKINSSGIDQCSSEGAYCQHNECVWDANRGDAICTVIYGQPGASGCDFLGKSCDKPMHAECRSSYCELVPGEGPQKCRGLGGSLVFPGEKCSATILFQGSGSAGGEKYSRNIASEEPRIEVAKLQRELGAVQRTVWGDVSKATLKVQVVEDPFCPFSKRFNDTLKTLRSEYGSALLIEPVYLPQHVGASVYAAAVYCASNFSSQKGEQVNNYIFDEKLKEEDLPLLAERVGINKSEFANCLASDDTKRAISADMEILQQNSVRGTPTFIVTKNIDSKGAKGKLYQGAYGIDDFKSRILR